MDTMTLKVCTKCGLDKPLSCYHYVPNGDKLRSWCKDCMNAHKSESKRDTSPITHRQADFITGKGLLLSVVVKLNEDSTCPAEMVNNGARFKLTGYRPRFEESRGMISIPVYKEIER